MSRSRPLAGALTGVLILTGCSVSVTAGPSAPPTSAASEPVVSAEPTPVDSPSAAAPADENAVPGYAVGQAPPVPLFSLPDVSRVSTAGKKLRDKLKVEIKDIPGVKITAVRCGKDGEYSNADSGLVLYGDGSGSYVGPDGSYTRGRDGSETSVSDRESITRDGKGGGTYVSGTVSITNAGDGSGTYVDAAVSISNDGRGTATVVGPSFSGTVAADPLAPVPPLGKFPPVVQLLPKIDVCGFVITLADGVLFDFDKDNIRADAAATLDKVAKALEQVGNHPIQIGGHTDAIGTDSYNQGLSERRASSVEQALRQRGVSAPMTSKGYGESRPVASNETAKGRALNRRVTIAVTR